MGKSIRRHGQPVPPIPGLRRLSIFGATIVGMIILLLTWILWHWSMLLLNSRLQEASGQSSIQVIERLESYLKDRLTALERIAQFCGHSENLQQIEFTGFSTAILSDVPGILCVFRTDTSGVPNWQTPETALRQEALFRLTTEPTLIQACQRGESSGTYALTPGLSIPDHGDGFMAAVPLVRAGHTQGFIIGVLTYSDMYHYMLDPRLMTQFKVALAHAGRVVYPNLTGAAAGFDTRMNRFITGTPPYQVNKTTYIGSQEWEISVEPVDKPTKPQNFAAWSIIMLGISLALVLGMLSYRWIWHTGQLQAEARLNKQRLEDTSVSLVEIKAELDLIFNSVDEGIILYDGNLNPIQTNAPFLSMFGLSERGLSGEQRNRQAHHEYMAHLIGSESKYLALFRTLQRHPEQIYTDEIEIDPERARGSRRVFVRRAMAVSGAAGQRKGLLVIYKDVTGLKGIEQAKDEFLAGVTHELRSPLSAIKGFVDTLRRDQNMPESTRREFIGIIHEETERLQNLIEELLDLRRMEASGIPLNAGSYDLKLLAQEVASSARSMLLAKNISLRLEWGDDEDCRFTGDAGQISRALRNLIVNAIKYSPQGGEIILRGHCGVKAGWIEVSDQGVGISENDLPHIFDKFYRGKSQGRQKGTGLGLAIVKHVVELHGGHIGVRSEVGRGTTFHIELPRQFQPPSQALLSSQAPGEETEEPTTAGLQISGRPSGATRVTTEA